RERVVQRSGIGADQMGEDLPLLLAAKIGAGGGRGDEKLREIAPLDAHDRPFRKAVGLRLRLANARRKSMRPHALAGDSRPPGASRTRVTNPCFSMVATI